VRKNEASEMYKDFHCDNKNLLNPFPVVFSPKLGFPRKSGVLCLSKFYGLFLISVHEKKNSFK